MSYDIRLVDPVTKEQLYSDVAHDMRGGMYAIGGTTELWLNITWNYAYYYEEGNRTKMDVYEAYRANIKHTIKTEEYDISEGDTSYYWEETAANAIRPLQQLIAMAQIRPDGIWEGD